MNSLIELLNLWGERFLSFAWPMLWQSSMLIAVLFVLDFAIRRRVRATVRYALWILALIKLVLPTSLSLPTSPAYWVQAPAVLDAALVIEIPRESPRPASEPASIVESSPGLAAPAPIQALTESSLQPFATAATISPESTPLLRWPAFIGLSWLVGAVALSLLVIHRGRLAWRLVADASDAPDEVQALVGECARRLGVSSRIVAKVTDALATPVVCGLFRPVILLPKSLTGRLAPEQLQAVLLHELAHVRRGDLWVSHLQTALQILHFYNPLLWLANARIRRVREEAVDEMVLVALADNAEVYPETLLNVAKLSRQSPRLAFGLIGILESKRSLGARIRLMLLRPWPKSARLGVKGIIALLVLGAMLLPMSCAKDRRATPAVLGPTMPPQVSFEVKFIELPTIDAEALREKLSALSNNSTGLRTSATSFWAFPLTAPQAKVVLEALESAPETKVFSAPEVTVMSGRQAHIEMTNLLRLVTHPVPIDAPAGKMKYSEIPGILRQIPIGPMVDVMPVVSSDGYSLQLTILPTITEFLGYNEPRMITIDAPVKAPDPLAPPTIAAIAAEERAARRTESIASSPLTAQLPSPRIRVRQLVTISTGWDGQPILLGGLIADRVQQVKERVPVLGDLPMLGKLFRPDSNSKRNLLIFITPTIVDSAGQPVHSDADMPFRKNSIPPQKLSESPQVSELLERQSRIEATGVELNKIERIGSPEKTTSEPSAVPSAILPPVGANQVGLSPARQALLRKLDTIRLDEVHFQRVPLSDVVRELRTQSKQYDPDKEGISFLITDSVGETLVSLNYRNVRLATVLEAIVKGADRPIKYSLEDYAVAFREDIIPSKQQQPLYTRFFKVDPNSFILSPGATGSTADAGRISAKAREFFTSLGLDLTFPKAVFYNERSGLLMVHAAMEDLDIIEDALHVLNTPLPQVKIEAKFVEIKREDAKALGVPWRSEDLILSTTNILGSPPRGNSSAPSPTGILTDSQFRVGMQALEKRTGTDIVSAPAVTTLSHRAAHIEATNPTNIVVQGQTQTIQLGPSLEVLAEVLPDKSVIELTVSAVVVQFFGYHDPGPGEDRKMLRFRDGDWVEEPGPTTGPVPKIRVRKLKVNARVWDGQTLVLGNPVSVNDNPAEPPGYKLLVLFVKPTIVDPAGNPIHTDADLPARTNSIPRPNADAPR